MSARVDTPFRFFPCFKSCRVLWRAFLSRATSQSKKAPLTLWRIDADQNDDVIWLQPVYFFAGCADPVSDDSPSASPITRFALHCPTTTEGYAVVQSRDDRYLSYITVNADGDALPGAWSFGQIQERGEESIASLLRINALFKVPGGQEYAAYALSLRR